MVQLCFASHRISPFRRFAVATLENLDTLRVIGGSLCQGGISEIEEDYDDIDPVFQSLHLTRLVMHDTHTPLGFPPTLLDLDLEMHGADFLGNAEELTRLTRLRMSGRRDGMEAWQKAPTITPLSSLRALQTLVYTDNERMSLAEVRMLARLPRLTSLDLGGMYDVECKKHVRLPHALATLTGLRSLGMTNIHKLKGWSALKSELPGHTVCDVTGTTFV